MTLQEFQEILHVCNVEVEIAYDENTQLKDLQLDSLDRSMVKYEMESALDREIPFVPDQTIGQLLASLGKEEV